MDQLADGVEPAPITVVPRDDAPGTRKKPEREPLHREQRVRVGTLELARELESEEGRGRRVRVLTTLEQRAVPVVVQGTDRPAPCSRRGPNALECAAPAGIDVKLPHERVVLVRAKLLRTAPSSTKAT